MQIQYTTVAPRCQGAFLTLILINIELVKQTTYLYKVVVI
ncbi:uncharacterized protein METZ01_LOCUS379095 [marine metagenome]|uniref:Uncharacterized protein n=1 Tax=marine metagenome TaxID=408172 RepID=A0A382TXJ3_9ZZZZ